MIAWLYGVGRNAIAAEARRRARELHTVRRIEGRRLLDRAALARIEERLDAERESRRLHRAIAELPEEDRALLELVSLDGLSIADAARVLGVKPATARVRLHRSRARVNAPCRARARARPAPGGTPMTQTPLDSFESALLARAAPAGGRAPGPASPARPRRRLRLAAVGATGVAASVVAVFGLGGSGGSPAYAVDKNSDGDVVVTVHRLDDAAGLEDALARHGASTPTSAMTPTASAAPSAAARTDNPCPSPRPRARAAVTQGQVEVHGGEDAGAGPTLSGPAGTRRRRGRPVRSRATTPPR